MTPQEKALARVLFKNRIYEADGQKFEDIFSVTMNYIEPDFQSIKPWGNIGDRKNDGYINNKGVFYQVFAPEDIQKSYPAVIKKIKTDFNGLIAQWSNVNEFYFVVNDKYKGVNADAELLLEQIKNDNGLTEAKILTPKDLENMLFNLADDQIFAIIGFLPNPMTITTLDYCVINEIISYIASSPLIKKDNDKIIVPDWSEKIIFNDLRGLEEIYLNNGFIQVACLNEYLNNNSDFLADELKNKIRSIYIDLSKEFQGKELFWKIVHTLTPIENSTYEAHCIVIMSKYFETCDIYEEPK